MDLGSPQLTVAVARRILHRAGLDPNDMAGQVTIRADDGRHYWTSPMETFDVTVPDSVFTLPFDVGRVEAGVAEDGRIAFVGDGPVPASTASGWIGAIYQARPDVQAVIHTHAPYIGVVATTGRVVEPYNNRSIIFYGDQAFYDDDGTATDSKERIVATLGRVNVLIMRNHGAVVVGESIETATGARRAPRGGRPLPGASPSGRRHAVSGQPGPGGPAGCARRKPRTVVGLACAPTHADRSRAFRDAGT